jgi:hypothetical protein
MKLGEKYILEMIIIIKFQKLYHLFSFPKPWAIMNTNYSNFPVLS